MQSKRGQGATEYLVILGAVLLVALVIVSLLGWFPALGGSTKEAQSKSYWTGATPFSITAFKFGITGDINLSVASRVGDKLNLTSVSLDDGLGGAALTWSPNSVYNAGEEKAASTNSASSLCNAATSGSPFEYKTVTFTYTQGGISGIKQTGARPLSGRCS